MRARQLILIGLIAFATAVIGVLVGRYFLPAPPQPAAELHAVLHEQLSLDPEQERRLEALEASFAVRRRALELEMRAENARLAGAIAAEHGNGPRVAAAVDASHRTMGQLQKETLAHIFAMRELLRPDQAVERQLVPADDLGEGRLPAAQHQRDELAVRAVGQAAVHRGSSVSALVTAASNFAA